MDTDVLDRLLPVATLVLGAFLTFLLQRSEGGYTRRIAAGDLLADLSRPIWSRDEPDGWVGLQVYLGKVRVYLREARVPERVIRALSEASEDFWRATEYMNGPDGEESLVMPDNAVAEALEIAQNRVHVYLRSDLRSKVREHRLRRFILRQVTEEQEADRGEGRR